MKALLRLTFTLLIRGIAELEDRKRAAVLGAADEILRDIKLKPEFFASSSRALTLLALANRHVHIPGEQGFSRHALYLLTDSYLERPMNVSDRYKINQKGDQEQLDAYAKYTDSSLTQQLSRWIADRNVLSAVRSELKLDKQQEQPFEIVVLDIIAEKESAAEFNKALGRDNMWLPPMWFDEIGSKRFLVFTRKEGEEILTASPSEIENAISLISHEYVHSQGSMMVSTLLGSLIEERRAELLSGDQNAYYDVRSFARYLRVISGYDVRDDLKKYPRDGEKVYTNMAKEIGLNPTLEILFSFHDAFLNAPNESITFINNHLGSRNGVLERLMQFEVAAGREAAMNERFLADIIKLRSEAYPDPDRFQLHLDDRLPIVWGLPSIANKIKDLLAGDSNYGVHTAMNPPGNNVLSRPRFYG